MENELMLKRIVDLLEYNFYIPSYQRGYRWNSNQVIDLLNDIDHFRPMPLEHNQDEKTWYCLQPIVVKTNGDKYEVIDGQQRLTTIYLLLHYLNLDYVERRRDKLFTIEYQTRQDSADFLSEIDRNVNIDNIDYYHMRNTYNVIEKWFSDKDSGFDVSEFRSKLKFNTRVIWYETKDVKSIDIFTRINIGKIPLTNAELIKALFLNSSNFDKDTNIKHRQFEIASEWDEIENQLRDDQLWYFFTKDENKYYNRIELIFELMVDDKDEDDFSTFRYFSKKFAKRDFELIDNVWREVKSYFMRVREWYKERDLYHKVGYLVHTDQKKVKDLIQMSSTLTKSEFSSHIDKQIKEGLESVTLDNLQYGDREVKTVLLLYNVLTMLTSDSERSYFPFDLYCKQKWDIEHVTSIKEQVPEEKDRSKWLEDASHYIDETEKGAKALIKVVNSFKEKGEYHDNDKFVILFEDIVAHFNSKVKDSNINDISNLTLLDSSTNRSYKNAVFPFKRKTIIDRDKNGVFIPICTKNVFLKYFSNYPPKISFWTDEDRDNYNEDIYKVLGQYVKIEND